MKELKELGDRLRKLKEENEARKKNIKKLKSDRTLLAEKNRYLAERLKDASVAYSNAGKSILDLVNRQVKPVKKKLEKFDSIYKKIYDYEKSVSEGLGKIEGFEDILNSLKTAVFNLEKGQTEFDSALKDLSNKTGKIGDAVLRLEGLKLDSKTFDGKVDELVGTISELNGNLNASAAGLRNDFQNSLTSLREDVDKLSERKEKGMEKDITEVESELKGRVKGMEKDFNISIKELGEGLGKLGERLARIESVKAGGKEVGDRIRSMEKGVAGVEKRVNEKINELSDMLLNVKAIKGDSKAVDEKINNLERGMNRMKDSFNEGIAKMKEGFWENLDALREDVDKLSERKERGMEKGMAGMEREFNKKIGDISSNLKEIGDMVLKLEGVKVDSNSFDEKVDNIDKGINGLRNDFQNSLTSLREDVDKLSERKEKGMEKDITEVESELKGRVKGMEKDFNISIKELGEGLGKLGERLARIESVKAGGKEVGEKLRRIEKDMSSFRKEFHYSLLNMRKDIDSLSERKEEKLGRGISEVEDDLNKKIEDLSSNFSELNEMVVSIRSTKGDSEAIDKRIKDLEGFLNASAAGLRNDFQNSLTSLREDVDKLSERKEKGMEKDITEVEEELGIKVMQVEKGLNAMKDNFDNVISSVRKEIKRSEGTKKEEINRVTREFFGIRAQIEERMKQLTDQFDQLDRFKDEFRKGFENRVASSEVSLKKLGDNLSKMDNQLEAINEKGVLNENNIKEIKNELRGISKSIKSLKRESSEELDKLIEEAGG